MDWKLAFAKRQGEAAEKIRQETILSKIACELSVGSLLNVDEAVPWALAWRKLTKGEDLDLNSAVANMAPSLNMKLPHADRGPLAAPGIHHQKKSHPKVFLAVDRPWSLAMYKVLLENLGCIVEGSSDLLHAPILVSPNERSITETNKYDLILYEKTKETSPDSDVADFCRAVKANDREYSRMTNFLATNTVVHILGEEENGALSLAQGAKLFLRRPFVVHLSRIRDLLLPESIRPTDRSRAFNKRAGYHRMLELMEKEPGGDDEDVLKDRYDQDITLRLPVTQDFDAEETEFLKKSASLANRDNHRLIGEVKKLKEQLLSTETLVATQAIDYQGKLKAMTANRDDLELQRAHLAKQLTYMTDRMERAEEVEKQRATTVKDSDEVKEAQQAEHKAKLRIAHLVSELEKERRMNAHRARGVKMGGGGKVNASTTSVAMQAGSGVTMFYNQPKKEVETQCELLTLAQLNKANAAQQEATKMVEDMMNADRERSIERRLSLSEGSLRRRESVLSRRATVQDFLDQNELQSLQNRVKSLETSLEAARSKVTSHHTEQKERQLQIETLKIEKNDLQELLSSTQACTIDERLAKVVSTNDSLGSLVHSLQANVNALETTAKEKDAATKHRERCFRIVLSIGVTRFAATLANLKLSSFKPRNLGNPGNPFQRSPGSPISNFEVSDLNSEDGSTASEVAQRHSPANKKTGVLGTSRKNSYSSSSNKLTPSSATSLVKPPAALTSLTPLPFGK